MIDKKSIKSIIKSKIRLFTTGDDSMAYLKAYRTGQYLLKIEGDCIREYNGSIKYRIRDNYVIEYLTGRVLYTIDGNYIKNYHTGRYLLTISSNVIRDYLTGRTLATFDDTTFKDYMSGMYQYKIEGFLSRREIYALIAILYAV